MGRELDEVRPTHRPLEVVRIFDAIRRFEQQSDDEFDPTDAVSDVSDPEDLERGIARGLGSALGILWVGIEMSPSGRYSNK